MARPRHAKPKDPRTGILMLLVVAALGVAAAGVVAFVDDPQVLRAVVAAIALLAVLATLTAEVTARRTARHNLRWMQEQSGQHTRQLELVHEEVLALRQLNLALTVDVGRLREQIVDYVAPVPTAPEPVYPALHLPLVRAAFSGDGEPAITDGQIWVAPSEPVEVSDEFDTTSVDAGADPARDRMLLDLTALQSTVFRPASNG
jgi:hypothetical protein